MHFQISLLGARYITAPSLVHNMVAELTSMLYSSPSIRNSTCLHLKKKKKNILNRKERKTLPVYYFHLGRPFSKVCLQRAVHTSLMLIMFDCLPHTPQPFYQSPAVVKFTLAFHKRVTVLVNVFQTQMPIIKAQSKVCLSFFVQLFKNSSSIFHLFANEFPCKGWFDSAQL